MGTTTAYHATKYGLVGMWGALGSVVVGVISYLAMTVGLSSATVGVYGLVKGEPRLPGLIAMGAGIALVLGYRFSA